MSNEMMKRSNKIFQFDPTIHAGHLITAATIIACTAGAWYDMRSSIAQIKEENAAQELRITENRKSQKDQTEKLSSDINALALMTRQDNVKLRDEMTAWFMRLSDKIDSKVDKK